MERNFCQICGRLAQTGYRCRRCTAAVRRYRLKLAAIKYLGGKCVHCNFDAHPAALSFHHREGGLTKDYTLADRMYSTSFANIVPELDKCDLVCNNCHAAIHSRYEITPDLVNAIFDYSGPLDFDVSPAFMELLDAPWQDDPLSDESDV